jgi:mannonate dehydratase
MNDSEKINQEWNTTFNINRRDFAKAALGGAALLASSGKTSATLPPIPPGIKIGTSARNPSAENVLYLRQLGMTWISSGDITPETATIDGFTHMREQWEAGGFRVYNESGRIAPNGNAVINVPEIVLNLPGRDERIEEFLSYIRFLGKAGIPYMTYGFEGNGNWRSGTATSKRGYLASDCDMASPSFHGGWNGTVYKAPLSHGRVYSREEIWENYTYFIKKVVPVAEDAGVKIGIHPDDPPQPILAGVPRLFTSFEGYKRAIEIADSPNVGVCLCVGSWLEGGSKMGADPVQVIKYFGSRKKLFKIHFRNVTAPLPHFTETLMDDGYYDMYRVMEALAEINFDGLVIPDHVPELVGSAAARAQAAGSESKGPLLPDPGLAYSLGYLNATLKAVMSTRRKG